jgi:predicted alpha/beta hydrolase family esterase
LAELLCKQFESAQKVIQKIGTTLLADWLSLNAAIESAEGEIIIVAHSLLLANQPLVKENKTHKIAGALLVAPADVDFQRTPRSN